MWLALGRAGELGHTGWAVAFRPELRICPVDSLGCKCVFNGFFVNWR
jgi:hypothetical protein